MSDEVCIQIFRDKRIDMITLAEFVRGLTTSLQHGKNKVGHEHGINMMIGPIELDIALEAVRGDGEVSYMTVYQNFEFERPNLNRIKFTINLGSENAGGE